MDKLVDYQIEEYCEAFFKTILRILLLFHLETKNMIHDSSHYYHSTAFNVIDKINISKLDWSTK